MCTGFVRHLWVRSVFDPQCRKWMTPGHTRSQRGITTLLQTSRSFLANVHERGNRKLWTGTWQPLDRFTVTSLKWKLFSCQHKKIETERSKQFAQCHKEPKHQLKSKQGQTPTAQLPATASAPHPRRTFLQSTKGQAREGPKWAVSLLTVSLHTDSQDTQGAYDLHPRTREVRTVRQPATN